MYVLHVLKLLKKMYLELKNHEYVTMKLLIPGQFCTYPLCSASVKTQELKKEANTIPFSALIFQFLLRQTNVLDWTSARPIHLSRVYAGHVSIMEAPEYNSYLKRELLL